MRCKYCGEEVESFFFFCPNCGGKIEGADAQLIDYSETEEVDYQLIDYSEPEKEEYDYHQKQEDDQRLFVKRKLLSYYSDSLFLTSCILSSIAWVLDLINKTFGLIGLIGIIFSWIIYDNAQSKKIKKNNLESLYILHKVAYIFNWISIGAIVVAGFLVAIVFDGVLKELKADFSQWAYPYLSSSYKAANFLESVSASGLIAIAIGIGILLTLYNLFITRPFMIYQNSLFTSAKEGVLKLKCVRDVIGANRFMGILYAILCLLAIFTFNIPSIVLAGCRAAGCFIDNSLIDKTFPGYARGLR